MTSFSLEEDNGKVLVQRMILILKGLRIATKVGVCTMKLEDI